MERFQNLENLIEGDEFVERVLYEIGQEEQQQTFDLGSNGLDQDPMVDVNNETVDSNGLDQNPVVAVNNETKKSKKRRANLTEFDESQSVKRKNESAKRELTSIVNQLGKIDKQLNTKEDPSGASINFIATFTTFKSNRVNTFKYPLEAEMQTTLLDFDTTMSAVKEAVQAAVRDLMPRKQADVALTTESSPMEMAETLITPTKTISTFTTFPSPVAVKKALPSTSKYLCGKNSCTFGKKMRKPVWEKCSHRCEDGQSCNYWVHAPCIGFPDFTEKDVLKLAGWCCPDHTEVQMKQK